MAFSTRNRRSSLDCQTNQTTRATTTRTTARKPVMTEEDEAFNEIERRSKVKQEILQHPSYEAQLKAEVAVLTELVRVLYAKIAELEKNT